MKKLLFLFLCISLYSCKKEYNIQRSFCYWKTQFNIDSDEATEMDTLGVKHLYLRFFDVGWSAFDNEPRPTATVGSYQVYNKAEITPSVFIKNEVLLYSNREQLQLLATNLTKRVNAIINDMAEKSGNRYSRSYDENGNEQFVEDNEKFKKQQDSIFRSHIKDVLIDCDWTVKSRDNYFFLLTEIKKILAPKYKLSATIRLWQYRDYEQSGIPPADRGLLMCYNMESAEKYDVKNSIATSADLKKYITHDKYKLPLDVALPVFSWSVVFRQGKFKGIVSDFYPFANPEKDTVTFTKKGDDRYVFNQDKVIGETYYRYGDEIRIEKTSSAEMEKMINILKDNINLENSRVTFFSWDRKYIDSYGTNTISGYYSLF